MRFWGLTPHIPCKVVYGTIIMGHSTLFLALALTSFIFRLPHRTAANPLGLLHPSLLCVMKVRPLHRSSSSVKNTAQWKDLGNPAHTKKSTRWILKLSLLCILVRVVFVATQAHSSFPMFDGEKALLSAVLAVEDHKDGDSLPSEVQTFIPNACHQHVVRSFPELTSLLEQGKGASLGSVGGHWSACTHVQLYGMNFAAFFARHLAYGLRPASVLEFGCGLGTTSDFLARFAPGGSRVVCVEPEAMLGEVFGGAGSSEHPFPRRPLQLAMLSFAPEAKSCSDQLFHTDMQFELVLSLEVAEHIPPEHTSELIERLARATTKYLVFSAARPGQGGTGHLDESMHDRSWWIEQFTTVRRGTATGKLKLLPQLSRALRYVTSYPERAYDFGTNLIAFGAPGVEDMAAVPQIAHDCFFHGRGSKEEHGDDADKAYAREHNLPAYLELERPCPLQSKEEIEKREAWLEGQAQALWPELDLLVRRVRSGELKCQ